MRVSMAGIGGHVVWFPIVLLAFCGFPSWQGRAQETGGSPPAGEKASNADVSLLDTSGLLNLGGQKVVEATSTEKQGNEPKGPVEVDASGKPNDDLFRLGNEAYEREDFEEAVAYYQAIMDRRVKNGDVYFNAANAYFRMGDFGHAVLYCEKARRLRPRDPDIPHNLAYVQTFSIDEPVRKPPSSLDTLLVFHRQTTFNETFWLLALLNLFFAGLLISRVLNLRFARSVYYGYIQGTIVTLFVLQILSAGAKVWEKNHFREGIILNDAVQAKAAPTANEVLAEVNSGTKVAILDARNGFAHIRLPNGIPAYILEGDVGEI